MIDSSTNPLFKEIQNHFEITNFTNNTAKGIGPAMTLFFDIEKLLNVKSIYEKGQFINNKVPSRENYASPRTWGLNQVSFEKPSYFNITFYTILIVNHTDIFTDLEALINNSSYTQVT